MPTMPTTWRSAWTSLARASAAAAYYERALTLANGSVLFDTAAARQRLDSLRAAAHSRRVVMATPVSQPDSSRSPEAGGR